MGKRTKVEPRSIQEWCNDFYKLYSKSDSKRKPEELWIATMAHCSDMGEGIRKTDYREIFESAIHVFCWMCSYVNICKNITEDLIFSFKDSLCDMVYLKFPGVCGHCMEAHCQCSPDKMDRTKNKAAKYAKLYRKAKPNMPIGYKLSDWIDLFQEMFSGRIHMMTLESIGFHFLEEAGEEMLGVRQLVQLRNVVNAGIKDVDQTFLKKITNLEGLIKEYTKCTNDKNLPKENGKPKIDYTSKNPVHIKARIVIAKMDFVIELADTFSWFCAILIKLQQIAKRNKMDNNFDLEKKLQDIYGKKGEDLKCSTCKKTLCNCVFFDK